LMVMSMNFGFDCFVYCLGLGFADWICLWYIDLCWTIVQHAIQFWKNYQHNQHKQHWCKIVLPMQFGYVYVLILFIIKQIGIQPNIFPTQSTFWTQWLCWFLTIQKQYFGKRWQRQGCEVVVPVGYM
jgi:hypothetical protein